MSVTINYSLSPAPKLQFIDGDGNPLVGAKLWTYAAGLDTEIDTYADSDGTPNSNPVITDADGRCTVYLGKLAYKFKLLDADDVLVFTQDNIVDPLAAVDGDIVGTTDTQTLSNKTIDNTNAITVKDTSLTIEDHTDITKTFGFDVSEVATATRRNLKIPDGSGRIATAAMFRSFQFKQGTATAAANDLTLPQDGNLFSITGSTQINAIATANWQAGSVVMLVFASTPLVKYNTAGGAGTAKILLQGAADFQTGTPDVLVLQYDGTVWIEISRAIHSLTNTGLLRREKVTLTNDEIKALPTTAIQIIANPGVNLFIKILLVDIRLDASGGAYTNVNAAAELYLRTKTGLRVLTNSEDHTLFDTAADIYEVEMSAKQGGGAALYSRRDNEAVSLFLDNQSDGNLTGGDGTNTLAVYVTYLVEDLRD